MAWYWGKLNPDAKAIYGNFCAWQKAPRNVTQEEVAHLHGPHRGVGRQQAPPQIHPPIGYTCPDSPPCSGCTWKLGMPHPK